MNQITHYYLQYYFNLIVVLIILFGIGHIIYGLFNKSATNYFFSLFFKLFTGLIIFTSSIAIYKTNLVTVNAIFFILGILYCVIKKPRIALNNLLQKESWKSNNIYTYRDKTLFCLLVSTILFLPEFILLVKNSNFHLAITDLDSVYYSNLSQFMSQSGEENTFHVLCLMEKNYLGLKPYHYFELWFNAGVTGILGGLNLINYKLVTSPVLYFMIFIGILAIWEKYNKITFLKIMSSIVLLFLSGIVLKFYLNFNILRFIDRFQIDIFSLTKLTLCYVFIIAFILTISTNRKIEAFFILLCIPVASIVNAPSIVGGIFLFLIINLYLKYLSRKEALIIFTSTLILGVSIILIYSLFQNNNFKSHASLNDSINDIRNIINWDNIKTQINIIIGTLLNLAILYLPFILPIAVLLYRTKIQNEIKLTLSILACILTCALLMWVLTFKLVNSVQLFNNIAAPLINSLIIFLFIITFEALYKNKSRLTYILLVYFLFLSSFTMWNKGNMELYKKTKRNTYSDAYIIEINKIISLPGINPIGAFIKQINPKNEAGHSLDNDDFPFIYNLGVYLNLLQNNFTTVSISDFQKLVLEERFIKMSSFTTAGIFYQFVKNQKDNNTFEKIEKSQMDFIDKYSIDYLIITKEVVLSNTIQNRVLKTLIDSSTGERFILLKKASDGN